MNGVYAQTRISFEWPADADFRFQQYLFRSLESYSVPAETAFLPVKTSNNRNMINYRSISNSFTKDYIWKFKRIFEGKPMF